MRSIVEKRDLYSRKETCIHVRGKSARKRILVGVHTQTHTHTHTLSLSLTHTHKHTPTHTHTHSHAHTRTHTHTRTSLVEDFWRVSSKTCKTFTASCGRCAFKYITPMLLYAFGRCGSNSKHLRVHINVWIHQGVHQHSVAVDVHL